MPSKRLTSFARKLRGNSTDAPRTVTIEAHGYRVIRFWNSEVIGNLDGVLETIVRELELAR